MRSSNRLENIKVRKTNMLVGENELWGNMPEAVKGFVSPYQN